ncbi:uncharacterized protein BKA78DRAFT_358011, partial [Phyllosticta capitalensis]|uniref:uncharacterized protein n=1 Tax=Phyllosticta capitalensis TaxID=121624 RepID=UPI00313089E6
SDEWIGEFCLRNKRSAVAPLPLLLLLLPLLLRHVVAASFHGQLLEHGLRLLNEFGQLAHLLALRGHHLLDQRFVLEQRHSLSSHGVQVVMVPFEPGQLGLQGANLGAQRALHLGHAFFEACNVFVGRGDVGDGGGGAWHVDGARCVVHGLLVCELRLSEPPD